MTEREYQYLLDTVQDAIGADADGTTAANPPCAPYAANDNSAEWPLTPFPEGWHASP